MVTYPEDWIETTIGKCVQIHQGGTPRTTDDTFWNGGIVWLTPGEVTKHDGLFIDNSERKITEKGLEHSSAELLPVGTILLCTRATIGDLAIAAIPLATNQGFKNLVCEAQIDNIFFSYLLYTRKEEMITKAIGTTFLEISKKELSKIEICIPHLKEQIAIGHVLRCFDNYIADLAELIEKKRGIREGALEDLVSGSTRLAGYEGTWEMMKLKAITSQITKGTTPLDKSGRGTVNFIKVENIDGSSGDISITQNISVNEHNGYLRRSRLENNDILFSIAGTLGRVAIVDSALLPANTNQALSIIRLTKGNHRFISYYLQSKAIKKYIQENPTVGAQPNLSLKQIGAIAIAFPSEKEQEAIADMLTAMDNEIEALEAERDKMIQIREGAMDDLLTGRVRLSV